VFVRGNIHSIVLNAELNAAIVVLLVVPFLTLGFTKSKNHFPDWRWRTLAIQVQR
jgi:hypothetical protein